MPGDANVDYSKMGPGQTPEDKKEHENCVLHCGFEAEFFGSTRR